MVERRQYDQSTQEACAAGYPSPTPLDGERVSGTPLPKERMYFPDLGSFLPGTDCDKLFTYNSSQF